MVGYLRSSAGTPYFIVGVRVLMGNGLGHGWKNRQAADPPTKWSNLRKCLAEVDVLYEPDHRQFSAQVVAVEKNHVHNWLREMRDRISRHTRKKNHISA